MTTATVSEYLPDQTVAKVDACEWLTAPRFALALVLAIVALYPEVMIGTQTFVFRDFSSFGYPVAFYHRECFWRGEIPLWNPLNNCGIPFLAQWNTLTLYPLSLIYLLFPLPWSLNIFCVFHLFLGGMGMFFLASRWTGCRFAGAGAGIVYAFSGLLVISLIWPNIIAVLGWTPWVILTVERAWKEGGAKLWLAALVGSLQMLAGMPEFIVLTWVLLFGLWLLDKPRWKTLARFASVVLLVSGLAAAQLLPFLELLSQSGRGGLFEPAVWAMSWSGLANFFVPLFHCRMSPQGVYFQADQSLFTSYYIGVPAVAMAACAVLWVRQRKVWFLATAAVLGVCLAVGNAGYLYKWLLELCPVFGLMRYPIKFLMVPVLTVPLLAAFGLAHWKSRVSPGFTVHSKVLVATGGLLIALIAGILIYAQLYSLPNHHGPFVWWNGLWRVVFLMVAVVALLALKRNGQSARWETSWSMVLLLGILVDSLTQAPQHYPTAPANVYAPGAIGVKLEEPPPPDRARAMTTRLTYEFVYSSMLSDTFKDMIGRRVSLFDNLNVLDNVASPDGFYAMYLSRQRETWSKVYSAEWERFPEGLADFLTLSHVTSLTNAMEWTIRSNAMTLVSAGQAARFVNATSTLPGLLHSSFNPRTTVYLPEEARSHVTVTNRTETRIVAQRVQSQVLEADVEAAEASLVVISQSHYRPWRAFVDGKPAQIWRANYAFQAVQIPAGQHKLRMIYKDRLFELGCVISLLSLGACLFAVFRLRKSLCRGTIA